MKSVMLDIIPKAMTGQVFIILFTAVTGVGNDILRQLPNCAFLPAPGEDQAGRIARPLMDAKP